LSAVLFLAPAQTDQPVAPPEETVEVTEAAPEQAPVSAPASEAPVSVPVSEEPASAPPSEAPVSVPASEAPAADVIPETTIRAAQQAVVSALLSLEIAVLEEQEALYEQRSVLDRLFDGYVQQRVPLRIVGICVTPDGMVLIRDPNLPLRRYARIKGTDVSGKTCELRVAAVLENHAAVLLEPVEPPKEPLPFLDFAEAGLAPGDLFLIADPTYLEETLAVEMRQVSGADIVVPGQEPIEHMLWWVTGASAEGIGHYVPLSALIILDKQAQPIGVALDSALWQTESGMDSWIGRSIMADRRISPAELEEITKRVLDEAATAVCEVGIQFREDSAIARRLGAENDTVHLYGLLLDQTGRVFIPTDMDRTAVRQIEKFTVKNGGGTIKAEFEGLFKEFGGLLLRAKGIEGKPATIEKTTWYPRGKMFQTLTVRRRYGSRFNEVEYNRYLDMATGYREAHYPVPRKPMRTGDLIADEQGRFIAFCAPYRRDDKDEILAGQTGQEGGEGRDVRMYYFAEIDGQLKAPQEHFDTAARPMTRREELGTAWLGVEYQQVTAPLTRALKVEGPTRGGSRGLLVTHVYENSPAMQQGIQVGDILLSLRAAGIAGELDLSLPEEYASTETRVRRRVVSRLWHPRINYLVLLLTRLGPGRQIEVRLLHEGVERSIPLTIEMSPENFDTAERYTDTLLDVTVRDLTYEVRSVLSLPNDAPGVVVSDTVSGGRADMAQVAPYDVITHVGDSPVDSAEEFGDLIRSAQAVGRVQLSVMRLGFTRRVEIDLLPK
jgi:hypothetical protein